MARPLDTYFVTLTVQAKCTLQIPAEDVGEAMQSAYRSPVLAERRYDIEKEVVKVLRLVETKKGLSSTEEGDLHEERTGRATQ